MLKKLAASAGLLTAVLAITTSAGVQALATPASAGVSAPASSTLSAADSTALSHLQTRGDAEIARRLTTLNKLSSVINSTVKLSSTDKDSLSNEASDAIAGLTTLKTSLDADTTLAAARTDAQSIINNYRVYALVVPKVYLLKASDTELVNDSKLTTLAGKLQDRINSDKTAGKDITSLQASLDDLSAQVTAAQNLANGVNAKVAPLQPTDYDTDHSILEGQRAQLQTAHQDNVKAYDDAKTIVSGL